MSLTLQIRYSHVPMYTQKGISQLSIPPSSRYFSFDDHFACMSLLDALKETWIAQIDTILHRHIPERLKAIESSISPEHNNAKKRRLNLDVVESKAIEEASYLIQYTGRGLYLSSLSFYIANVLYKSDRMG